MRRQRTCLLILAICLSHAAQAGQERFRKSPPVPESFRELRLPTLESGTLANGLTVTAASRPGAPLVTLQLILFAGEADSPTTLPGLATVTAKMIGRGTELYSSDQIEGMIESIGADFSVSVAMDYTVFTFNVLEQYLDKALSIMRMMFLEPQMSNLDVDTVKRTFFYSLKELNKDPEFVGRTQLMRILFEGHPYQTANYYEDAIPRISTKDVAVFYSRFYRPNNAVFATTGNLSLAVASRKVSRYFGPWLRQPVDRPSPPVPRPNNRERVCFVDHPPSQDATIFVGNLAMPADSPDFFPFMVLDQVLGGTYGSRLFMNLRETRGYAYNAFSEAGFFRSTGAYWAKAEVPRESIFPAVQEIIKELRILSMERVRPDEIEQAKSFLIGNLPLKFANGPAFASRLASITGLRLGDALWNGFADNLMLVDGEKVLDVAARYFAPVPVVVIVGNREWAGVELKDFNMVEVYDRFGTLKMTLQKGVER